MIIKILLILMHLSACVPVINKDPLALHTVPEVSCEQRRQAKDRLQQSYDEERKKLEEEKASMIEKQKM